MNQMTADTLVSHTMQDGLRRITLGGGRAHALSSAMIAAIHAALDEAAEDDATHAVLLEAPGSIFCAGHDLKEIARHQQHDADEGIAYLRQLFADCAAMMVRLAEHPKPTIAMVEGIATAAGLQMAASCDLVFASTEARFCLPGVNNGGFCTTPAVGVSRRVPKRVTLELALSGETFDAAWAESRGLVNRVFPPDALEAETLDFALRLAGRNPGPVVAGKAAFLAHQGLPLTAAYALAGETMLGHFTDPVRVAKARARWGGAE